MTIQDIRNPFGEDVFFINETESTMKDAAALDKWAHGTVVQAGYQKSGRGRGLNRTWESAKGENLLFTICLDPDRINHPLMRIPLISGMALAECLKETFDCKVSLKWPNDVLVSEKKVAGILCEYRSGKLLLGVGVNCLQKSFPDEISNKTTSLVLEGAVHCSPAEILELYLQYLKDSLETEGWKEKALSFLYKLEETVLISEGTPENETIVEIKIMGLSDEGFLIVKDVEQGRIRLISAGEIRFLPFR
ncbi:MAG: biotin--[acetyl-CoA-carboxylase] ligase [Spirochaetales bacterium]|nr:biotin--[acetyl-CoA-carboxylase] ligase [Spirochaetales bacterium]